MSSFRQHFRNLIIIPANQEWPEYAGVKLQLSTANLSSYRQHLGEQHTCIFFSAARTFHADAFLALSGTLAGGGLLVLQAPPQATPAWQRLLHYCNQHGIDTQLATATVAQQHCDALTTRLANSAEKRTIGAITPTPEQDQALAQLQHLSSAKHSDNSSPSCAVMINAARGRGKSTLLGLWINAEPSISFVVCAPSKRQAAHILETAPQPVTFIAPDRLLDYQPQPQQWLLIDEAASIPSHVLATIAERWQRLALATTTEGYESAGRGFLLRFQQKLPHYFQQVLNIELREPVRWASGDPLEAALNACFCLQNSVHTARTANAKTTPQQINASALHYRVCHAAELSHEELTLAFALLSAAHYQTSPNDLCLLLTDAAQQLFLQYLDQQIVGVCWVAHEGPLPAELVAPIYQGKRRPPGNLLPQTLVFHLREQAAATLPMLRIVRITILPELQGQGLGSQLLQHIIEYANSQVALVGTSFGGSKALHKFWHHAGFQPVRLGLKKDAASGLRSLVYLKYSDSHPEAAQLTNSLSRQFATLLIGYAAAAPDILSELNWLFEWRDAIENRGDVPLPTEQFLADFAAGYIPFAVVQPLLATAILQQQLPQNFDNLLHLVALSNKNLSSIAKQLGFHGKAALIAQLKVLAQQIVMRE